MSESKKEFPKLPEGFKWALPVFAAFLAFSRVSIINPNGVEIAVAFGESNVEAANSLSSFIEGMKS